MPVILTHLCYPCSPMGNTCAIEGNMLQFVWEHFYNHQVGEQVIAHMKMVISTHYLKDGDYCVCTEYQ